MTINGLTCQLVEKKGKKAEIKIEDQKITVSIELIPASVKPGESLKLYFLNSEEAIDSEKKIAKSILEEILNGT